MRLFASINFSRLLRVNDLGVSDAWEEESDKLNVLLKSLTEFSMRVKKVDVFIETLRNLQHFDEFASRLLSTLLNFFAPR